MSAGNYLITLILRTTRVRLDTDERLCGIGTLGR